MPWVKLTDDWYDDEAIAACDDHGIALWVLGLSWCARNLSDGAIPAAMVRRLSTHDDPPSVADRLVDLGLWSSTDTGYRVENYHAYQPTRAEVLAKRAAERERSQRRRDRAVDQPEADAEAGPRPGPSRVPSPSPIDPPVVVSECDRHDGGPVDDGDEGSRKRSAWSTIAGWKADEKGKAGHAGWLRSCIRNQPSDPHPDGGTFDEQANRLLERHPDLSGYELAQALTGRLSKQTLHLRRASA